MHVAQDEASEAAEPTFMRGRGPQGLRAFSMAASEVSNTSIAGEHMVVHLPPGISKVCQPSAQACLTCHKPEVQNTFGSAVV